MKNKEALTGEQIVDMCLGSDYFNPYCKQSCCIYYEDCSNKNSFSVNCEDAMATYLDSEETQADNLLRRLAEEENKLINLDIIHDVKAMKQIELFDEIINYIREKESAEN